MDWSSSGRRRQLVQNMIYLYLRLSSGVTMIHTRLISGCDWKLRYGAVWSWLPASSGQPSSTQAQCPCWGIPQRGSCGCGWLPWVAVLQGVWPCPPHWPLPIWWRGNPSTHVLLMLTSPASLSGRHFGAPSVWSRSHQCMPCQAADDFTHHLRRLLHWQGVLHFGQHWAEWPPLIWRPPVVAPILSCCSVADTLKLWMN